MMEGVRIGRISFLFAVFLVSSSQIQGSRAQTPVFVKTGDDLHLKVKGADLPERFSFLEWRFNGSVDVVTFLPGSREPRVSPNYTGRVEVSVFFSVKLKNLQKSDSGVYAAHATRIDKSPIAPGYDVTVEDPVSPVNLTVDSVTNSSDSCDLTVTCRSLDSHQISITVTCNTTTCSQEGGERSKVTTSGATLHVYLKNDMIICNHSNQVSWTSDSMMIGRFCPRRTDPEPGHGQHSIILIVGIVVVVIIAVAVGVVLLVYLIKQRVVDHWTQFTT